MTYNFDPELAAVVAVLPPLDITDVLAARAGLAEMMAQMPAFVPPAGITVEKRTVAGPSGDPDIEVCILAPRQRSAEAVAGLVWIHGGGFVLGDVDGDLSGPSQFVDELGIVVVSVEYRLAPEHPFPAPVEDCYAGLKWTAEHAGELGIDLTRLAIGGLSAGAGLAAAVALMARDRGGPALSFQLLDIPELDDQLTTHSMRAYTDTPIWHRPNAVLSWQMYLGPDHTGETSPYASPTRATDLSGLPPAYVVVGEFDPLRDEGIEYAQRLIQSGVATELHMYPGTFHGSIGAGVGSAISARMTRDRLEAVQRALG